MRIVILLTATVMVGTALLPHPLPGASYRVLVSTDLGGDPDDIQSLYRLVHYSDMLKVEGIVSSPGPGSKNAMANIKQWIRRIDPDALRRGGHSELMSEAQLLACVRQGSTTPGAPSPARSNEGSRLIVERARAAGNATLWVLVWGSLTDVAQALHDDPSIASRIRIYYIGSSNTRADEASRDYVFAGMQSGKWPGLWWIENGIYPYHSHDTFRGVYQGGDQSGEWNSQRFVTDNIRGRGTTHDGMFAELSGDAFPLAGGILKEGDSPSMLYLLSPLLGGAGNIDDPTRESWGGRFRRLDAERFPNYYVDLDSPPEECQATISKWRAAYLGNWKRRWSWYPVLSNNQATRE